MRGTFLMAKKRDRKIGTEADWPVTMVYNTALIDFDLNTYDKLTYVMLCKYANVKTKECWPSYSTLQDLVGCSRAKVAQSLKRLEELGYITKKKTDGKSNIYKINEKRTSSPHELVKKETSSPGELGSSPHELGLVHQVNSNYINNNYNKKLNSKDKNSKEKYEDFYL